MAASTPEFTVIRADTLLGESPLWCPDTQSLAWIDGSRPQLLRWRRGAPPQAEAFAQQRPPAALARLHDGRLLVAFRERFAVTNDPSATVQELQVTGLALGDERFNDAKVDAAGRLWIGTIDRALTRPIGCLRRFDAAGVHVAARGYALSNGIGFGPDGTTLWFSESFERQVHRFRCDPASGHVEPDGLLASYAGGEPKPDGLAVDAEGGIWCVVFGAGRIDRYRPDGTLERSLRLPVSRPTSCCFGGPDLRTLFVTTATYGLTPQQCAAEPLAGSVLALPVDVAGLPVPAIAEDNVLARAAARLPAIQD